MLAYAVIASIHLDLSPFIFCFSVQLLEYVGKGKSIIDVGLAQARRCLSTRSHYFEVEIVDPGEKCFIGLGLARKVYFLLITLGCMCRVLHVI